VAGEQVVQVVQVVMGDRCEDESTSSGVSSVSYPFFETKNSACAYILQYESE
jgi:hypothetical protein